MQKSTRDIKRLCKVNKILVSHTQSKQSLQKNARKQRREAELVPVVVLSPWEQLGKCLQLHCFHSSASRCPTQAVHLNPEEKIAG
jgi:hypothetical protein